MATDHDLHPLVFFPLKAPTSLRCALSTICSHLWVNLGINGSMAPAFKAPKRVFLVFPQPCPGYAFCYFAAK